MHARGEGGYAGGRALGHRERPWLVALPASEAQVRQAEGDVHGGLEFEGLHRREALVVVEGDDGVEVAAQLAPENGVAGQALGDAGAVHPDFG